MSRFFSRLDGGDSLDYKSVIYFIFRRVGTGVGPGVGVGAGVGAGVGVDREPGVGAGVGVGRAPSRLRTPGTHYSSLLLYAHYYPPPFVESPSFPLFFSIMMLTVQQDADLYLKSDTHKQLCTAPW